MKCAVTSEPAYDRNCRAPVSESSSVRISLVFMSRFISRAMRKRTCTCASVPVHQSDGSIWFAVDYLIVDYSPLESEREF